MTDRYSLHHGSMRDYLPTLDESSIDACVSDPPYELGFMGRKWDKSGIAFQPETWAAVLRVLKPGAHLVAFGGTRTFHRIACAIEDAGFEIRDSIAWLHGQGFPKSLNLTEQIGTALKPAFEPIIVARKACDGTIKHTFLEYGTAGLNIGACRVGPVTDTRRAKGHSGAFPHSDDAWVPHLEIGDQCDAGRWPPNTLLSHADGCQRTGTRSVKAHPTWDTPNRQTKSTFIGSGEPSGVVHGDGETEEVPVWRCVEGCPVAELDGQSGELKGGFMPAGTTRATRTGYSGHMPHETARDTIADSGSASRFFPQFQRSELDDITPFRYAAKPSRGERDNGLDYFRHRSGAEVTGSKEGQARLNSPRSGAGRNEGARNVHPTVKGIELMRWLVRLVTPPGGIVLDPFTGSGTTGVAAMLEGLRFAGCELNDTDEEPFVSIATARMRHVLGLTTVPRESIRTAEPPRQGALF